MRWLRPISFMAACATCHSHPDDHAHGDESAARPEAEEPEPIAITRWTDRYELFVELPPPVVGKPIPYHAHVTRLSDFQAVTEGKFVVRYKSSSGQITEHAQTGVKRPGIFVFEGEAPSAGEYRMEMSYSIGETTDAWDCGTIVVNAKTPPIEQAPPDASITFLKESQWKLPFGTAWVTELPVAHRLEVPAVVENAGGNQLTLNAPTSGRFLHDPKRALGPGTKLAVGDVVGTLVPSVKNDDYTTLVFAVEEARLEHEQALAELERIKPLIEQGVLPQKRQTTLQNEAELLSGRLKLARSRLGAVTAKDGGIALRSEKAGVVAAVLVSNGEVVEAGAPLVRLSGGDTLWLRARFFPRGALDNAVPAHLRLPSGASVSLGAARFLSAEPLVDPSSRVATWIADLGPGSATLNADLRAGSSAVLTIRFGEPKPKVVLPRSAIVEINTRPYAFVQIDGEHFEKRSLSLEKPDGDWVPVLDGVKVGERVVTKGGFDIHLAAVLGTVESHRH